MLTPAFASSIFMPELAPVYVNDERVRLQGEPKPKVSNIVTAAGKEPTQVQVQRLRQRTDQNGQDLLLEDVIDRTQDTNEVFLRCIEQGAEAAATQEGFGKGGPQPANAASKPSRPEPSPTATARPEPPNPEAGPEPHQPAESGGSRPRSPQ